MQLTDEQIYAKDAQDYLPVFARYKIVLDHGDMTLRAINILIFWAVLR